MAPKRKAPASKPAAAKPRLSKLAKQHHITNAQEEEISEAFGLLAEFGVDGFAKEKVHGVLAVENVTRTLAALGFGIPEEDVEDVMEVLDPEEEGYVTYATFLEYAAMRINAEAEEEGDERVEREVGELWDMFRGKGEGNITIAHLRRVAKTIREDIDDETLKQMIMEANGKGGSSWKDGVTMEEFGDVLKRAGVF